MLLVSCDSSPGQCYQSSGYCSGGSCNYDYADAGTSCDDGNKCTSSSACDGSGNCVGTSNSRFLFLRTLGTASVSCTTSQQCYHSTGTCRQSDGGCDFTVNSGAGCDDGIACTSGDTCAGDGSCG